MKKIIVAITGASGSIYGVELLKTLKQIGAETHLIISKSASMVINLETSYDIEYIKSLATYNYAEGDISSICASGSNYFDAMFIAPCSMNTLAKIANGIADNLIVRSADVMLKERQKLIIIPRETPLNLIHIENMKKLTLAGGILFPPDIAFYTKPETIEDCVKQTVLHMLKTSGIDKDMLVKWKK